MQLHPNSASDTLHNREWLQMLPKAPSSLKREPKIDNDFRLRNEQNKKTRCSKQDDYPPMKG